MKKRKIKVIKTDKKGRRKKTKWKKTFNAINKKEKPSIRKR